MIDRSQASSALAEIEEIGARVRQSLFYRRASAMLILWGALTFGGKPLLEGAELAVAE